MNPRWPAEGTVYTETVVHTPPERYVSDSPYQLAVIETGNHERFTVRIALELISDRIQIGERVRFLEERDGVAYYRRLKD